VKGPEEDSVQALPMPMGWISQVGSVRLIGFLPTMHKPRRASSKYWLGQLERLAQRHRFRERPLLGTFLSPVRAGPPPACAGCGVLTG
jgi:hypothetical protein